MKHDFIDKYSHLDSVLHRLDPRVKLVLCFLFLVLIGLGNTARPLGLYAPVILGLLAVSRAPLGFYLGKLLMITPLVLVFSFFIYLSFLVENRIDVSWSAFSFAYPVWDTMGLTAARVYLSVLVVTLLVSTTRFGDLLWGLRKFKLPLVATTLSRLVYNYIFVFIDELHRNLRACKSRTPVRRVSRFKVYGHIAAAVLLRSINRSDHIYKAMISRGFNGEFPEGNRNCYGPADLTAVLLFLTMTTAAAVLTW